MYCSIPPTTPTTPTKRSTPAGSPHARRPRDPKPPEDRRRVRRQPAAHQGQKRVQIWAREPWLSSICLRHCLLFPYSDLNDRYQNIPFTVGSATRARFFKIDSARRAARTRVLRGWRCGAPSSVSSCKPVRAAANPTPPESDDICEDQTAEIWKVLCLLDVDVELERFTKTWLLSLTSILIQSKTDRLNLQAKWLGETLDSLMNQRWTVMNKVGANLARLPI